MTESVYIYVSKNKGVKARTAIKVRASVNRVAMGSDELELKLNLEIPDELFTRPDLEVNLEVAADTNAVPNVKIKANAVSDWLKK